ncbi:diphosphomevalonate decarboxylase [bacterium]|nr:diphosphomevalonate decarboxylase [bacterium]
MGFAVRVRAPSNIALIKYMGKSDPELNIPSNPSLSLTLNSLCTWTELEQIQDGGEFRLEWNGAARMEDVVLLPFDLREKDRPKIERHFKRVFQFFGHSYSGHWRVRSGNTFPAGAGIASSASGFSALTLAIAAALGRDRSAQAELPQLSRQGSGSSCRSFQGPWVLWQGENATKLSTNFDSLSDIVFLIEKSEKTVGSTEAHLRVKSSPLWEKRNERVSFRIQELQGCLLMGNWSGFSQLVWEEAMDMHELFHTSSPSFSYWTPLTREILGWLESEGVRSGKVRAAVTLDAGPNVHLLIPQCDQRYWLDKIKARYPELELLVDQEGPGAQVVWHAEGLK